MCIIVDANKVSSTLGASRDDIGVEICRWLGSTKGGMVIGGHLRTELARDKTALDFVTELQRVGRVYNKIEWEPQIKQCMQKLVGRLVSDDPHVLALAIVSGARTLITSDKKLQQDFTDNTIISKPQGKIYSSVKHAHLLKHSSRCPKKGDNKRKK